MSRVDGCSGTDGEVLLVLLALLDCCLLLLLPPLTLSLAVRLLLAMFGGEIEREGDNQMMKEVQEDGSKL